MSEDFKPHRYEAIAISSESTVVAEFVPEPGGREATYQSEVNRPGICGGCLV